MASRAPRRLAKRRSHCERNTPALPTSTPNTHRRVPSPSTLISGASLESPPTIAGSCKFTNIRRWIVPIKFLLLLLCLQLSFHGALPPSGGNTLASGRPAGCVVLPPCAHGCTSQRSCSRCSCEAHRVSSHTALRGAPAEGRKKGEAGQGGLHGRLYLLKAGDTGDYNVGWDAKIYEAVGGSYVVWRRRRTHY